MFDSTPLMRGHAALRYFELGVASSACMQGSVLKGLAHHAASTRFGKDHGFAAIDTVQMFQKNVPLRRYEDFFREYWQPVFPRLVDSSWPGLIPYLLSPLGQRRARLNSFRARGRWSSLTGVERTRFSCTTL